MIRPGFLDIESRQNLIELARDGSAAHRLARRANALVLLDDGMSCEAIAKVLLLDDDTIRTWYRLYEEDGIEGLTNFGYEGSACQLSGEQQENLKTSPFIIMFQNTIQLAERANVKGFVMGPSTDVVYYNLTTK